MATQLEKHAYIAQYFGQQVQYNNLFNFKALTQVCPASFANEAIPHLTLHLKPLSSISDEDAIECSRIHYGTDRHEMISKEPIRYISNCKKYIIDPIEVTILAVTDFLRSKGYALPWRQYSVEQLISMGWLKLAEPC